VRALRGRWTVTLLLGGGWEAIWVGLSALDRAWLSRD